MKALNPFIFVWALLLSGACTGNKSFNEKSLNDCPQIATRQLVGTDSVVVLNMSLVKDTLDIPLSQLIEDFEIIKLDSKDEALTKPGLVCISDNYMGIHNYSKMPYKLFDRQGNYLYAVGNIGQGPNEYLLLYASQIDEQNNRIYLLPWTSNKLLVYDLKGNNLPPIPLPYIVPKGVFHVDAEKAVLTIATLPFQYTNTKSVLWQQDLKGNMIQEIDAEPYRISDDYSNEIDGYMNKGSFSFHIFNWTACNDSLYHYNPEENRLIPVFTADFKTEDTPKHSFLELPGYYIADIITEIVNGSGVGHVDILVDKQSLKGTYFNLVNDYLGNIPVQHLYMYFRNDKFLMNMDPGDLVEQLEAVLSSPGKLSEEEVKRLTAFKNSISPNDNNYVLTGKVKSTGGNLSLTVASPTVNKPLKKEIPEVPTPQAGLSPEADSVWSIPHNTAYLKEWKTYFRTNNKYKDWDPDNGKVIALTAIIEKDGSATDLKFAWAADLDTRKKSLANRRNNSDGIQELEEEALRLIREAKIDPGKDKEGNPVRSKWIITVEFPPR